MSRPHAAEGSIEEVFGRAFAYTQDEELVAHRLLRWDRRPHEPERAREDVRIDRPDLGTGRHTLIRAGATIPPALASYPRRPARER